MESESESGRRVCMWREGECEWSGRVSGESELVERERESGERVCVERKSEWRERK